MGDDRPSRYVERTAGGRPLRVVYRASGLGGCERAFVADARGLPKSPHPEWFQTVLEEGNVAEQQILDMWESMGGGPTAGQQEELTLDLGIDAIVDGKEVPIIVRAHVDGFGLPDDTNGRTTLRECKKFRPSTYPTFKQKGCEINQLYPWQLASMMFAIHQDTGEYPLVEMLGGLWDVDTQTVTELAVHYIDNPPIPLRAIKKKIARIEQLLADGYDPTDDEVVCHETQFPCGFWKLHPSELSGDKAAHRVEVKAKKKAEAEAAMVDLTDSFKTDVLRKALADETTINKQISAMVKQIEGWKRARDEARKTIGDALVANGVGEGQKAVVGGWVLHRVHTVVKAHEVKESTRDYVTVNQRGMGE